MILTIVNILSLLMLTNSNQGLNLDAFLHDQLSNYSRIEYTVVSPNNIDLTKCKIDDSRDTKLVGKFAYLPIKETNSNGSSNNKLITVKLKLFKNVLVANRDLSKKEYLNKNDFRVAEKEVASLRSAPVNISAHIGDYRSKLRISEKTVLEENMLEKIPDIKIGDRVQAMFINNSVNISFAVTARTEGVVGDIIKIKNDDKKIFKARIINNTSVKIIE